MPTKTDGSAAGSRILVNCCAATGGSCVRRRASMRRVPDESFERLQDDRRQPGGEADDDDGGRAAAEGHQEQRIHEHDRRRGQRADPGLERQTASARSGTAAAPSGMPTTNSSSAAHSISCIVCQNRCSTFSSTMMRGTRRRISQGSGTMKRIDHRGANENLHHADHQQHAGAHRTREAPKRESARPERHRSPRRFFAHARLVVLDAAPRFLAQVAARFRRRSGRMVAADDARIARMRQQRCRRSASACRAGRSSPAHDPRAAPPRSGCA